MRNTRLKQYGRFAPMVLAICLIARPAATGLADIFYVDGTRDGGGSSWADAYKYLQDALYDSGLSSGDEIGVAGGTYFPDDGDDVQQGEEAEKFKLKNGVNVEGGYHGYCPFFCPPELRDEVSILSGDIVDPGNRSAGDSRHVIWTGTLAAATVLDGFTIEWGNADETSDPDCDGGGLYVKNCSALTVSNCTFQKNHAREFGGAVMVTFNSGAPANSEVIFDQCDFDDNDSGNDGGAIHFYAPVTEPDQDITVLDCDFTNNETLVADDGRGAGILINGAEVITITDCDFIDNCGASYGALSIGPVAGSATITRCLFDGNTAGISAGGAYVSYAGTATFDTCTFKDNTSVEGGGALWALVDRNKTFTVDLKNCKFLRNKMTTDVADTGGGGVFFSAAKFNGENDPIDGILKGTWTNCDFIENSGFRGGAAYMKSCELVEIENCRFVANRSFLGGGALCMSDKSEFGTSIETRICNSKFISNRAEDGIYTPLTPDNKGGAVYSRFGANTTMVNCIIAGNFSEEQGGGTCNADDGAAPSDSVFDLHNCLLVGNWCKTNVIGDLDVGGGHFNRQGGESELIHCTIADNYADYKYGGVANVNDVDEQELLVRNSLIWNNDALNGTVLEKQLHYEDGFNSGDVDHNLIDGCAGTCFNGGDNIGDGEDPSFVETGLAVTSTVVVFDGDTGQTTFTVSGLTEEAHIDMMLQPDDGEWDQLLILSNTATQIVCLGKFVSNVSITGTIRDYRIGTGSDAIDYGDAAYIDSLTNGGSGDVCDLNGINGMDEPLPYDLDSPNGRNQGTGPAPDAGAFEIPD